MTKRPRWAEESPSMRDYYDHYWGIPDHDENHLFKMLTLELFQAGLTWATIWQRQAAFSQAFADFDVDQVANFNQDDIERLMQDKHIIRNRRKILATINNAQVISRWHRDGNNFTDYVWSFVDGQSQRLRLNGQPLPAQTPASVAMSKQMKKDGFKFVGPTIIYSFMTAVGLVNAREE